MRIPPALEEAAYRAARAVIGDAPLATSALIKAVVDRSKRYTSDRAHLAQRDAGDLAARAVFFTVADAMKLAIPIGELLRLDALPAARPLRVTDLGAGCGAMTLGLLATVEHSVSATLVDRDTEALDIATRAIAAFGGSRATIATRTGDAHATAIPPSDLVLIGTLLNELAPSSRLSLIQRALAALAPDGALIIIEPALRETTRALHELRDQVRAQQLAHVVAPCIRQGPCPALANPDDWCHEDRSVQLSPQTAELARLTHLRDDGLKFSYLVLRAQPVLQPIGSWRLVSSARVAKGKHEVTGCGDAGWQTLRLLKRNRTPQTKILERAERGDLVVTDAVIGPERVEITAESRIDRIDRIG